MASFTGVGDNTTLFQADRGEDVAVEVDHRQGRVAGPAGG